MEDLYTKTSILVITMFLLITAISAEGGFSDTLLQKQCFNPDPSFDRQITLLMKIGNMPSLSACIIKNNSVVWSKGYGFYDLENKKKASNDTIYMAGSISKTITATAILQLYEKGLFNLSDNVNDRLPFNLTNPKYPEINITYKMLLAHRSSLGGSTNLSLSRFELTKISFLNLLALLKCDFPEDPYPWLEEILVPGGDKYNAEIWADYPPGERFNYSNIGFIVLGYLVEIWSGQPFEQYCEENIFEPLNMTDTSFHYANLKREAIPYIHLPVRLPGVYIPLPHYDLRCFKAAGGLRTTVEDLSHFLIAHMNGGVYKDVRILKKETIDLMHKESYPDDGYGLGWLILSNDETYEGHSGTIYGFMSHMFMKNPGNTGIIFFYNEWYPPLFSKTYLTLRKALADRAIFSALFKKAAEL
jgi:CubicO group peptidase (beta-lactamase class C family)